MSRSISDHEYKNSQIEDRQEDQRAGRKDASVDVSFIQIFAEYSVGREPDKTAERIHDDVGNVGDTDSERELDSLDRKTKREYRGELMLEGDLFEIDAEHHSERDEGYDVRDHFAPLRPRKRDQVEASGLIITNDRERFVGKFEQHEPQQHE